VLVGFAVLVGRTVPVVGGRVFVGPALGVLVRGRGVEVAPEPMVRVGVLRIGRVRVGVDVSKRSSVAVAWAPGVLVSVALPTGRVRVDVGRIGVIVGVFARPAVKVAVELPTGRVRVAVP
jgi:hypothetical protein